MADSTRATPPAPIVLYDGLCGLCNRLNRLVLRHDRRDRFRFASLQSDFGRAVLTRHGHDPDALETLYLVLDHGLAGERLLARSAAALRIAAELGGRFRILSPLALLPLGWRDRAYAIVARSRYVWFGRSSSCELPAPRDRHKFIAI